MTLDYDRIKRDFFNPKKNKRTMSDVLYSSFLYKEQKRLVKELGVTFKHFLYVSTLLPKSFDNFFSPCVYTVDDEAKGIGCLTIQCIQYASEINEYLILKNKYEDYLLSGDYQQCIECLDCIDSICCSLWSLENRLLIIYLNQGIEAALQFKDNFSVKHKSIVSFLLSFFWKKLETKYSLNPIEQYLNSTLNEAECDDSLRSPFRYEMLKYRSNYNRGNVFWYVLRTSIIDVYEFLLESLASIECNGKERYNIESAVKDLSSVINDRRIIYLNYHFNSANINSNDIEHDRLLELYKESYFERIKLEAPSYLLKSPSDFDIIDIFCKSYIHQNDEIKVPSELKNTILAEIIISYFKYLRKDEKSEIAYSRLVVISNMLSSLKIGNCLNEKITYYEVFGKSLDKYYLYNTCLKSSGPDIDENEDYLTIYKSGLPCFIRERALTYCFNKYIQSGQIEQAFAIYNEAYFQNKVLIRNIDCTELIKQQEDCFIRLGGSPLENCIFFSLIEAPEYIVYYFFKQFIRTQTTLKPSDFFDDYKDNLSSMMEYFFFKICTPRILSLYVRLFKNSNNVLDERLLILKKLSSINNKKEYLEEITEITRKLSLRARVKQLDQRMIYVDEKALKETEMAEVQQLFNIYLATESTIKTKKIYIANGKNSNDPINVDFYIEDVQYKFLLFNQLFTEIRRKFLTSYKNGLDFYISTRIRHGTLINQLRRSFEEYGLVTNIYDNEYRLDTKISEVTLRLNGVVKDSVQQILLDFTKDIDDKILSVKNEVVQVQSYDLEQQHPNAIFNYDKLISTTKLYVWFLEDLSAVDDFNDFLNRCFAFLWRCTELQLDFMHEYLDNLKLQFSIKLTNLRSNIEKIVGENAGLDNLAEIIEMTRDGMISDVNKVKGWFYRNKEDEGDFTFKEAVDACIHSVNLHRNTSLCPLIDGDSSTTLSGVYFRKISDLLLIFLNNIVDYSKKRNANSSSIIKIEEDENLINFEIRNKILNKDIEELKNHIESVKPKLGNPQYLSKATKEKGSGLFKAYNIVHKMLPYDEHVFDVYIDSDNFCVKFRLDTIYLAKQ